MLIITNHTTKLLQITSALVITNYDSFLLQITAKFLQIETGITNHDKIITICDTITNYVNY